MKKIIFLLALLASMAANAAVTVTPLSANYGATKTVTFRVSWEGTATDRAWVWVDLCPVTGTSPGTFAKAVISGATATAGSIDAATLNGRGFYVTTSPSTVTATLSNATGKFNWCVYGSDAPPKVTAENGTYTLYGTSPFTLIAAGGTATQTVAATSIATSAITITPVTLTDQTGCPGIFCIYTGTDLFIDGTHLCQQRATGAQNWEAWIKDSRDDELYRIVLMPDNKWWLAQNLKYTGTGQAITISGCTPEICGRYYGPAQFNTASSGSSGWGENKQGVCPTQWVLPTESNWKTLFTSISTTVSVVCERLRELTNTCTPRPDYYGWANKMRVSYNNIAEFNSQWWHNTSKYSYCRIEHQHNVGNVCNYYECMGNAVDVNLISVRCFRQL